MTDKTNQPLDQKPVLAVHEKVAYISSVMITFVVQDDSSGKLTLREFYLGEEKPNQPEQPS